MNVQFGFVHFFLAFAASIIADEPPDADPVESYRQQVTSLREAYDLRVQQLEKTQTEMVNKFSELTGKYRDEAVAKLRAMISEVQATDLDQAVAFRNAAVALEQEPIPTVEETKTSESSMVRRLRLQIQELEKQLNNFYGLDRQLLINASFEQIPRRGVVSGWQNKSGNWELAGTEYGNREEAADGKAFLFAGECKVGHLVQDVDITACGPLTDTGKLKFTVSALIRCFRQNPPDTSELRIEFLDERDTLLKIFTTGPQSNADGWIPIGVQNVVPKKTRTIRVNLLSRRHGARTRKNNGYFDNSQLILGRVE